MRELVCLILIASLPAVFVASASAHAPYESVKLAPLHGSGVSGRVYYRAVGAGTNVSVKLRGVPLGATSRVLLRSGSCRRHGLSFAAVVLGQLRFHGAPVAISTVADGKHVFTVVINGRESACAVIPGLD